MLYIFLLISFLNADISNILLQIDKIEKYQLKFKQINIKCNVIKLFIHSKTTPVNSNLKLNAIFNKKALINNRWFSEGNVINGYKIIKIYSQEVLLKKDDKFLILKFDNNLLKVKK